MDVDRAKMAEMSRVDATIEANAVPLLPDARSLTERGFVPGGSRRNLAWASDRLDTGGFDEVTVTLLADAQTSGGLLFGVRPEQAADSLSRLRDSGHDAAVVGAVVHGAGRLRLR